MRVNFSLNLRYLALATSLVFAGSTSPALAATSKLIVGGERPVPVHLPAKLVSPAPLLILMHSASSSGIRQEKSTKLAAAAKKAGIIFLAPDGTIGPDGRRVWNAAKSCCQKKGIDVDDANYISSLIEEISLQVSVDQDRIYMVGHSNGAFMSIAFACSTGRIAGVVSLAGAMDTDMQCESERPFSFLQIHGTDDATIKFDGGLHNSHPYTGAEETVSRIARVNGCKGSPFKPIALKKKDFDRSIQGAETTVHSVDGCKEPVALWQISGGQHSPKLPANYAEQIISFLTTEKTGK